MRPTVVARVLLALGFVAAPLAYGSWIAGRTIFDPGATRGAAQALLATPSVRATLSRGLHDAVAANLGKKADDPKVAAAIEAAIADPRFTHAFADAIARIDASLLSDRPGRTTLSPRAVTASLDRALTRIDPKLASRAHGVAPLQLNFGSAHLPVLGSTRHSVSVLGDVTAALAVLLLAGALAVAPGRRVCADIGRRTAYLAIAPLVLFGAMPWLLHSTHGNTQLVLAAVLHAYGRRVLPSALALAAGGLGAWIVAATLPRAPEAEPATTPVPAPGYAPAASPYAHSSARHAGSVPDAPAEGRRFYL